LTIEKKKGKGWHKYRALCDGTRGYGVPEPFLEVKHANQF